MKKIIVLSIVFLFSFSVNAQFKKKSREKIRAYKIAFLTDRLNLNEKESEKFWLIYNAYDKRMMDLRYKERVEVFKKVKKANGVVNISEQESEKMVLKMESLESERYKLQVQFISQVKRVLPYKKILELRVAERDFHRKLMRKLKGKKKTEK